MRHGAATSHGDGGETLLELVVTVLIMGIALTAIIGGIGLSVLVSDTHRKQATAGATVRDYAEAIENKVSAGGYTACPGPATYQPPLGLVPSGYSASVVGVRSLNGTGGTVSCASDEGLQQLTLQVASDDDRASERLVLTVRKPCRLLDTPCG